MWKLIFSLFFLTHPVALSGKSSISRTYPLKHLASDCNNLASLQRGAKYFMNFCSGCHSLQFMQYNRLAIDLKIIDKNNLKASRQRLNDNLVFVQTDPSNSIKANLRKKEALLWFGKIPPDLSLITRTRSIDWVYTYLLSFYLDSTRPFGVNNRLVKNTIMPDPLALLRIIPPNDYRAINKINSNLNQHQLLINANNHKFLALTGVAIDLVNFLAYVAEPTKIVRQALGIKVCGFLLFFTCLVYFLKQQIWKNIK
jgi:ubiquinol-cytochrome c reductase cytochrome c1 subunit